MALASTELRQRDWHQSRWIVAQLWLGALLAYVLAIMLLPAPTAIWVNDLAWTAASLSALLICLRTARRADNQTRRAWSFMASACASWCIGQMHWNYNQLVLGIELPFPNIGQIFFSGFAVITIAGILQFPEVRQAAPLTLKHAGNVALVVCCLLATVVLGLLESLLSSQASLAFILIGTAHSALLAGTFLFALFALWTYRWNRSWTPMLLLVIGTGIYSIANLIFSRAVLAGTYTTGSLVNTGWCMVFGCIAWAAHEQWWLDEHPAAEAPHRMLDRERWLEAIVPALLIAIMVSIALAQSTTLTSRTLGWAAFVYIVFALILGVREAWIQSEAQRLNVELVQANRSLAIANTELRASERRYRELNSELEQRVAGRSAELGRAYGELEDFAYAVAHDLKAPLRSINSFAHLLRERLGQEVTPQIDSHLSRIRNGSLRMATLIDDLLAYSHIERRELRLSEVDLSSMIASILAHCADEVQRRGIAVQLDLQPLKLSIDAEGLILVLRNLIENALKYSRNVAHPELRISARTTLHALLLEVADNGIGFEMQYHEQIFGIFQRLHRDEQYPGTGIGLAIVRKAVQRLHGRVWAESEPGKGARFFVELPLVCVVPP